MTPRGVPPLAKVWCEALAGKDTPAIRALLDEASQLHMPGKSGLDGDYQGGEAILGLLRRMAVLTNGTLRFSRSQVLTADDNTVVMWGRVSAARSGKRFDAATVHVLTLEHGALREAWMFHQNQDQVDDFWAA